MGADGSRLTAEQRQEKAEILMEQNCEIARRLSNEQKSNRTRNDRILFGVGKHMFADLKKHKNGFSPNTIEIDGVQYDLLDVIGKGGFGEVYKAQMRNKETIVAIKIMKNLANLREEIEDEIHFLNLMNKFSIKPLPIIKYFGAKITPQTIHMAMELASCDLLKFWMDDVANADAERKFLLGLTVIIYVLRALTFLERLEIIHGDIKPQNIVIVPRNDRFCIKLIDFGTIEKMDPFRTHLTVEAAKPHTLFFASPEFIRRNSENVMARRLHKKSDAWAAGVMFYFFFFERLPWRDQFEFDAFCNDPHASDIVVPRHGGFKSIIELLLKKNPDERASAKSTLMQIKAHPNIRDIIDSLNESFCSVDDVCRMRISDDLRNELAKLARPGHFVRVRRESTGRPRESCRYAERCFRHDKAHREDFAHPGDRDFRRSNSGVEEKTPCRYGASCFRVDTDHLQRYAHPEARIHSRNSSKINCQYGEDCYNFDTDHRRQFAHPSTLRNNFDQTAKDDCWFGWGCTDRSPDHRRKYSHPDDSNDKTLKPACRYGSSCTDNDRDHRAQFFHPKTKCYHGDFCTKTRDPEHRAKFSH